MVIREVYKYMFKMSSNAEQYCDMIVNEMVSLFNISYQEALGRVNRHWSHCTYIGDDSLIFHMIPEEWAYDIYYGVNSQWWKKDKSDLTPAPFKEGK